MKILLLPIASENPAIPKHIDEVDFLAAARHWAASGAPIF